MAKKSQRKKDRQSQRTQGWLAKKRKRNESIQRENGLALRTPLAPPRPRVRDMHLEWIQAAFYPAITGREQVESE